MNHPTDKLILAVDPGKTGAIAAVFPDGTIRTANFCTEKDSADTINKWVVSALLDHGVTKTVAYVESIHSSPQQGPSQAFAFGENFGVWKGIFANTTVETHLVKPQEWQRMIPGRGGAEGPKLKRILKAHAQRLFPNIKVTLVNADALLILKYGCGLSN